MKSIPVTPVSGMRDFLPLDVAQRDHVIQCIRRVFELYGFLPMETPALERLSTLQGKYGEEGEQLMYKVLKRGAKLERARALEAGADALADMGLRYDLTVPLARLAAAHSGELLPVFKRYQIQPVYRAERPAKGRYREFLQCDVDIVGLESVDAEADVINAGVQILRALGFDKPDDFSIRLNHRGVLMGLLRTARVPKDLTASALVAIDKADKIGVEGVQRELVDRQLPPESVRTLMRFMAECGGEENRDSMLPRVAGLLAQDEAGQDGLADLRLLMELLDHGPAGSAVRLDPFLARGMGYYTGPIYEIQFPDLSSSGGGGGRYDELLGLFAGRRIPACGFSLGLERILLIMNQRHMFPPDLNRSAQVLVAQLERALSPYMHTVAHALRQAGLRADLFPAPGRLRQQFRYAEKRGIRLMVIAGASEAEAQEVSLRDLERGERIRLDRDQAAAQLHRWLNEAA